MLPFVRFSSKYFFKKKMNYPSFVLVAIYEQKEKMEKDLQNQP